MAFAAPPRRQEDANQTRRTQLQYSEPRAYRTSAMEATTASYIPLADIAKIHHIVAITERWVSLS